MGRAFAVVLGPWIAAIVPAFVLMDVYQFVRHPGVRDTDGLLDIGAVGFVAWLAFGALGAAIAFRRFTRDDGPASRPGSS
jgi:hypothetical protein